MFKGLQEYTKELEQSANLTQRFVQQLAGGIRRLENAIAKAENDIKFAKNETKFVAELKPQVAKEGIRAAKDILFGKAIEAIKENYEFDEAPYRKALFEAIADNDTYLVRQRGSGFKSVVVIDINLDKTAGRLNLWGSAVKAARRELGVKIPSKKAGEAKQQKSALAASRAWSKIFSNRGGASSTFSKTVRTRLKFSAKIAPFWQLLDKGEVPLHSDRGGYATPKKRATNFVDQSEKAVNTYISNLLLKEKEKYTQLISNYNAPLNEAREGLEELYNLIQEIRLDQKTIQGLGRRANRVLKANYSNKLEKAVQLIREGLFAAGKLRLATKGSYRGKRLSTETIKELLY